MKSSAADIPRTELSEGQRRALVTLLADEDGSVYQAVRSRILACGLDAVRWMRPHTLSADPRLRRRVWEIIEHLERQEADTDFLTFCVTHGEDLNLELGIWMLARTQYPEINLVAYQALLDVFAGDLRERTAGEGSPVGQLAAINDYVFEELGFRGNQEDYYNPDNSYLNRVIDRRTGNPISLCVLYWLLSRRLQLPVVGIGMPGHFICRYQGPTEAFYIDVFNQGRLLTRADCVKYLQNSGHGFQESFLAPASSGRTLLRMCSNLHQIYSHLELEEETARIQRYLIALAK